MADDGPLSKMMKEIPEGEFVLFLDELLYWREVDISIWDKIEFSHSPSGKETLQILRKIRTYLQLIAYDKLKKTTPEWVKELWKLL